MTQQEAFGWWIVGFAIIGAVTMLLLPDVILRILRTLAWMLRPTIPVAGENWIERYETEPNPWLRKPKQPVSIIETKDGWVKYGWWRKYMAGDGSGEQQIWTTHERPIKSFKQRFRKVPSVQSDHICNMYCDIPCDRTDQSCPVCGKPMIRGDLMWFCPGGSGCGHKQAIKEKKVASESFGDSAKGMPSIINTILREKAIYRSKHGRDPNVIHIIASVLIEITDFFKTDPLGNFAREWEYHRLLIGMKVKHADVIEGAPLFTLAFEAAAIDKPKAKHIAIMDPNFETPTQDERDRFIAFYSKFLNSDRVLDIAPKGVVGFVRVDENGEIKPLPVVTAADTSEVAALKRDNEELRKFLTAERIENNRLRGTVSDLASGVGMAIGFIRGVRISDNDIPQCNTCLDYLHAILGRMTAEAKP